METTIEAIEFDAETHRALRLCAEATARTVSEVVNEAVRLAICEDDEDSAAFEERRSEPDLDFASVVEDVRRRGVL